MGIPTRAQAWYDAQEPAFKANLDAYADGVNRYATAHPDQIPDSLKVVLPVSAAERIAWSMRSTLVLAMAVGLGSAVIGLTVAYYADLPPGGTIVLVAAGSFAVCTVVASVRG